MNKKYAKVKSTRRSLMMSVLSLMLSVAMLLGTTYAWFTDTVTSGINQIQAGNLDVELYHESKNVAKEKVTESTENLFKDVALWEPGAYAYETFTVVNEGTLALKFKMALNVLAYTSYNGHNLTEVIKVATTDTAPTSRADVTGLTYTALKDWTLEKTSDTELLPTKEDKFTVVLYWEPTADDNNFNMNNGKPEPLTVDLGIKLVATQATVEKDSFNEKYDKDATNTLPEPTKYESKLEEAKSVPTPVEEDGSLIVTAAATPTTNTASERQNTTVTFPAGTFTDKAGKNAVLTVKTSNSLFNVTKAGAKVASVDLKLTIDGESVTIFAKPATVETYISSGLADVNVEYVGEGAPATDVAYNYEDGKLTFNTTHFSEFGEEGSAIAFIDGDVDAGYAPHFAPGATEEQKKEAIEKAYEEAAEAAKNTNVTLVSDADMKEASKAAEEKGAAFVIPTQTVQEIDETRETEEKVQNNFDARVGTKYFGTLAAAVNSAASGDTIVMLRNVELKNRVYLKDGTTLDGNGFNLTCSTEEDSYYVNNGSKTNPSSSAVGLLELSANVSATVKNITVETKAFARCNISTAAGSTLTLDNVTLKHVEYSSRGNDGLQLNGALIVKNALRIEMGSNIRYYKDKNGGFVEEGFTNRAWGGISFNDPNCTINFTDCTSFVMTDGGTAKEGEEAYGLTQAPIHLFPYDAKQWDKVTGWDKIAGLVKVDGGEAAQFGFAFENSDYMTRKGFKYFVNDVYYNSLEKAKKALPEGYKIDEETGKAVVCDHSNFTCGAPYTETTHNHVCVDCGHVKTCAYAFDENGICSCGYMTDEAMLKAYPKATCRVGNTAYEFPFGENTTSGKANSALKAAKSGDTIKLIADYKTTNAFYAFGKSNDFELTIDLNGKEISVPTTVQLTVGTYNIIDSSAAKTGKINNVSTYNNQDRLNVVTLNVYGGTIDKIATNGDNGDKNVTIYGGNIGELQVQGSEWAGPEGTPQHRRAVDKVVVNGGKINYISFYNTVDGVLTANVPMQLVEITGQDKIDYYGSAWVADAYRLYTVTEAK